MKDNTYLYTLLLAITLLFGCASGETGSSEGRLTLQSPAFPELAGVTSGVSAVLKVAEKECSLSINEDTTLHGQCQSIPFGTYSYTLEYHYKRTDDDYLITIARAMGSITISEGETVEIPFPMLDKSIDDDGDGVTNLVEIMNGSDPTDPLDPPPCTTVITPPNQSFSPEVGTDNVSVTTQSRCAWTAQSNDPWITIATGDSGSGSGTVEYAVEVNPDITQRSGTITIGENLFEVTQDGIACSYSITPASRSFLPEGGASSVDVTALSGCTWTAQSNDPWITITSGGNGSGSGTVEYSVEVNSCTSVRDGTMTIAENTFSIQQMQSAASPLSRPTGVTRIPGDGSVTISWDTAPDATSYNIYMNTSAGASKTNYMDVVNVSAASYTWTSLTNGTYYYFVVTALNSCVESVESSNVNAKPSQGVDLPGTGQTTCYDVSGYTISCAGTGQDGEIKAGVSWPEPRFMDNGDGTVVDNLAGLMWLKDANVMASRDPGFDLDETAGDGVVTWQHALNYVAKLNDESYLGYTDWRLPNINELESLVNAEEASTMAWLNLQGFTNVQSDNYWSSTTYVYLNKFPFATAWAVEMSFGYVSVNGKSDVSGVVWPRRDGQQNSPANIWRTGQAACYDDSYKNLSCTGTGQDGEIKAGVIWPYPRFTDNGDGTVVDNLTGLMWLKDANIMGSRDPGFDLDGTAGDGAVTWQHALDYVAKLNLDSYIGYTDWRLPNRKELQSLTDFSQSSPALPIGHLFVNVKDDEYWSSTTDANDTKSAYTIDMTDGYVHNIIRYKNTLFHLWLWPVRAGW